tara:strand:+ start:1306 stop:2079 length:774 start_codon:yes stop_codon:yes gene_type:complete
MFINNFDPVAFQVFFIEIRWYSLAYIFGLILGWIYCKTILIKEQKIKNIFDDYISYLIIGVIVGGRLGYVFIYNPDYYLNNINEIPMLWKGGMSFHGGLIGVILATFLFCKKNNQKVFYFLDLVAVTAPIGIFLGRVSNFINSELYGRESDVFWSVKFIQVDNLNRHPSQIYEAIFEGLILFFILNIFYNKFSQKNGVISSLFIILYSLFRFLIEFTRSPDPHLGLVFFKLSMGQVLSVLFICSGLLLFYICNEFKK